MIPNLMKPYRYTNSYDYKELYFKLLLELYKLTNENIYKYNRVKLIVEKEVKHIQKFIQKSKQQMRVTEYGK